MKNQSLSTRNVDAESDEEKVSFKSESPEKKGAKRKKLGFSVTDSLGRRLLTTFKMTSTTVRDFTVGVKKNPDKTQMKPVYFDDNRLYEN